MRSKKAHISVIIGWFFPLRSFSRTSLVQSSSTETTLCCFFVNSSMRVRCAMAAANRASRVDRLPSPASQSAPAVSPPPTSSGTQTPAGMGGSSFKGRSLTVSEGSSTRDADATELRRETSAADAPAPSSTEDRAAAEGVFYRAGAKREGDADSASAVDVDGGAADEGMPLGCPRESGEARAAEPREDSSCGATASNSCCIARAGAPLPLALRPAGNPDAYNSASFPSARRAQHAKAKRPVHATSSCSSDILIPFTASPTFGGKLHGSNSAGG